MKKTEKRALQKLFYFIFELKISEIYFNFVSVLISMCNTDDFADTFFVLKRAVNLMSKFLFISFVCE